ncbi:SPW repeat protein [Sinomonas sp. ASV486]|uniref:SPW repeat protein n=1 Tax=Sinomonas puerhi TaxID=3238584 RepID=A0AB39L6U3_9MICC|nr:SPW repeat protein [Sinomonas sp. ASV486]MDQ4492299.1 SPW repeat protein [Sinomonas sp. ASV486]
MKKWTRWEDYVAIVAGLYAALATLWTTQTTSSTSLMLVFGVLLVVSGVTNLAMPSTPWLEYAQCAFGVLLFASPWMGMYTAHMGASWTSWIAGIIAAGATAAAFKPAIDAQHHRVMPSH